MSEDHLSGFLNRVKHTQAEKREAASERAVRSMETGYRGQSGTFGARVSSGSRRVGTSVGRGVHTFGRALVSSSNKVSRGANAIEMDINRTPSARNTARRGGFIEPNSIIAYSGGGRAPRRAKDINEGYGLSGFGIQNDFGFGGFGSNYSVFETGYRGSGARKKHKKKKKAGKTITINLG